MIHLHVYTFYPIKSINDTPVEETNGADVNFVTQTGIYIIVTMTPFCYIYIYIYIVTYIYKLCIYIYIYI